jgi:hypothetical protein
LSLPYNNFFGSLNGKTIVDFTKQLDYTITSQEKRNELVDKIVNTQHVGNIDLPDKFFEEFFEQKDIENGIDKSHIKLCLTTKDNLSDKNGVCKALEKMADYILYAPDGEKITRKTEYNFYRDETIFKKMQKQISLDELTAKINKDGDFNSKEEVIDFLIRKGQNYKKEIEQIITKKDLQNEKLYYLKDYQNVIDSCNRRYEYVKIIQKQKNIIKRMRKKEKRELLKTINSKNQLNLIDYINKKILENNMIILNNICYKTIRDKKQIKKMEEDQIRIKDNILGTIYFKQCMADSTEVDYDQFDFFNREHISSLLKFKPNPDLTDDLGCLTQDLHNLLMKCNLKDKEIDILELWRCELTQENIGDVLGVTQQEINRTLNQIVNKIMFEYENQLEDWYYLNIRKGKYKICSKCGRIYIANERHFSPKKDSKDGLHPYCKECRSRI